MVTAMSNVAVRDEFFALVLADPDLLDLAFAEVIASWEAESPPPPDRTLVVTAELPIPQSRSWRANDGRLCWRRWTRAIPRPKVARSPPELSMRGVPSRPLGGTHRRRGRSIRLAPVWAPHTPEVTIRFHGQHHGRQSQTTRTRRPASPIAGPVLSHHVSQDNTVSECRNLLTYSLDASVNPHVALAASASGRDRQAAQRQAHLPMSRSWPVPHLQ